MYLSFVISSILKFESPLLIVKFFDSSNFKYNSELICILICNFYFFWVLRGVLLGLVLGTIFYWVLKEIIFCKSNHFLICSSSLLLISYHSLQFICFGVNSVFTWCNWTHPSHYHLKFFILPPFLQYRCQIFNNLNLVIVLIKGRGQTVFKS